MLEKTIMNKESKVFSKQLPFFTPTGSVARSQYPETARPFFSTSALVARSAKFIPGVSENREKNNLNSIGKSSTDNRFINCDDKDKALIQDAFNQAIIQVSAAITRLNDAIENLDKKLPIDAGTTYLLKYFFKTVDKNDLQFILSRFITLDNQMVTGLKFKCIQDPITCLNTGGFVDRIQFTSIRFGPIHICVDNFREQSLSNRTKIIIHEASHRYIKASDFGYFGIDAAKLTGHPEKAIKNADSYALFALKS